jgi:hypothetical protein
LVKKLKNAITEDAEAQIALTELDESIADWTDEKRIWSELEANALQKRKNDVNVMAIYDVNLPKGKYTGVNLKITK